MKFESKLGLGEIVIHEVKRNGQRTQEAILEIVSVVFQKNGTLYVCRYPQTGVMSHFLESELLGDPDFDHESGGYKETADSEDV